MRHIGYFVPRGATSLHHRQHRNSHQPQHNEARRPGEACGLRGVDVVVVDEVPLRHIASTCKSPRPAQLKEPSHADTARRLPRVRPQR